MKAPPAAGKRRLDMVPVDELVAALRNPKMHDLEGIAASYRRFGYADTVLIDERTGRTTSGHGRVEALQMMRDRGEDPPDGITVARDGTWSLPVNRGWRSTDDAHAEGYLLSANRQGERGGWDTDLLRQVVADLAEFDEEILADAGYDELDRHDLLAGWDGPGGRGQSPPDEFPPLGDIDTEYRCPQCGHGWNGNPTP